MIGVDTNVLVRFLVEDDEKQSRQAAAFFRKAIEDGERIYFADVVLVEFVWVLNRAYRVSRAETANALRMLLSARHAVFESADRLARAVRRYENGKGGFSDYLVGEHAREAGCRKIVTFDGVLLREEGYERP